MAEIRKEGETGDLFFLYRFKTTPTTSKTAKKPKILRSVWENWLASIAGMVSDLKNLSSLPAFFAYWLKLVVNDSRPIFLRRPTFFFCLIRNLRIL